ncbi:hypothetical protein OG596_34890 [Streptomyces sp. NBC_01102]|uniref:hypothetical protein n=1 Tax=unclassified Streptomyces TaxID=2593676 RepID=UPI0038653621|nr:hypothetical protein OG596_34890 [Streptomyces sp. NBC_01102]
MSGSARHPAAPPPRSPPLRLLAEVAAADPAAVTPAMPALHALLDTDERPVRHDQWGAVRDDGAVRAAVGAVLDAAAAKDATTADAVGEQVPGT